jgi:hypothetical protein
VAPPAVVPPESQAWQGIDTSITHPGQVVVRTDEQWIHFWAEHHPEEASPDVDFTRNMVIGIFVGSRPADKFSVQITNVRTVSNMLVVDYQERTPPTGTLEVGVTAYPYALKVIPKSNLRVKFNPIARPES